MSHRAAFLWTLDLCKLAPTGLGALAIPNALGGVSGLLPSAGFWVLPNQTAFTRLPSTLVSVSVTSNAQAGGSLNLSGMPVLATLVCEGNALTSVNIANSPALVTVRLKDNALTSASVDAILVALAAGGLSNGTCDLSGSTNGNPGDDGLAAFSVLQARGWTVTVHPL